jgi:hypothetical protein
MKSPGEPVRVTDRIPAIENDRNEVVPVVPSVFGSPTTVPSKLLLASTTRSAIGSNDVYQNPKNWIVDAKSMVIVGSVASKITTSPECGGKASLA